MDIWRLRPGRRYGRCMSSAILVAESEPDTRGFLQRHLADDGYHVVAADDPRAAQVPVPPDLVLLGDAAALEAWQPSCPVIVLGAAGADAIDRVRAFRRGCDDYVPRPFDYEELLERVRAVLRRTSAPRRDRVEVGELVVDLPTRRVSVGDYPVPLAAKEYDLLLKLASDPTRVFTKEELLRDVWDYHAPARTRTLDSHASRLRRKLLAAGGDGFVVNEWGVGYSLVDS
jgi:DNA-binding response OmpR family regulator